MEKKSYSEKLKDPRWQRKRLEVMQRDEWRCRICGDDKSPLNVHHLKYDNSGEPWRSGTDDLITLCENCHKIIGWLGARDDMKELMPDEVVGTKMLFSDGTSVYFHKVRSYIVATCLMSDGQITGFFLPKGYVERLRDFIDKVFVDVEEVC